MPDDPPSLNARRDDPVRRNGANGREPLSPWATRQLEALHALGPEPLDWPAGDPAELPPAAREAVKQLRG